MYTRYTRVNTICTPNTPLNTLNTPYIHHYMVGPATGNTLLKASIIFFRFHPQVGPASGGTRVVITGRDYAGMLLNISVYIQSIFSLCFSIKFSLY